MSLKRLDKRRGDTPILIFTDGFCDVGRAVELLIDEETNNFEKTFAFGHRRRAVAVVTARI